LVFRAPRTNDDETVKNVIIKNDAWGSTIDAGAQRAVVFPFTFIGGTRAREIFDKYSFREQCKFAKYTMSCHNISSRDEGFLIDDGRSWEPDFMARSPSDLRNHARQSYDTGRIHQDTFAAISEPLPMQTINPAGDILHLSFVTYGQVSIFATTTWTSCRSPCRSAIQRR
jgi:hypothetical protein